MEDYKEMWTEATLLVLDLKQTIRTQKGIIDCAEIDAENYKIGVGIQNKKIDKLNRLIDKLEDELEMIKRG